MNLSKENAVQMLLQLNAFSINFSKRNKIIFLIGTTDSLKLNAIQMLSQINALLIQFSKRNETQFFNIIMNLTK